MTRRFLGVLPCLMVITGCVTVARTHEGNPIDSSRAESIRLGETTKAEITDWFGAPFRIEKSDVAALAQSALSRFVGDQLTLKLDPALYNDVYLYQQEHGRSIFVAGILFNYFGSDTRFDRLAVVFDQDDKVVAYGWTPVDWSR